MVGVSCQSNVTLGTVDRTADESASRVRRSRVTCIPLYTGFVDNLVDLVCRDAWAQSCRSDIQNLSCQTAHLPHSILGLGIKQVDLVWAHVGTASLGNAVGRVVRVWDRVGDGSRVGERVDRSQGAREGKGREGVEIARLWIRFRYYFGRDEVVQYTGFLFMHQLVRALLVQAGAG